MPNTSYDYYVQADCGGTGTSTWSGPFTFVTDVLGTADNVIDGFTYHPNPMNEVLHLRANSTIESVVIYNILGQKVIDQNIGKATTELSVSNLSTGNYFMKVISEEQTGIYKLIKK
ncbi:T9SS type A sorting domain-containing protein [Aequorivita antarctica]|uniref:T9SS type A sorting domain-containing protein n=2 Tax=Aequorivita antarctica TaxID=153266 RepID=A0A5C6Z024_9FLAO|nr:T9SS type A sorting domain-containing protein [Aequorivita antarctica]